MPLALFRTPVDTSFSSVEEPSFSSRRGIENSLTALKGTPAHQHESGQEFDDDDYEFQQALQASLMEPGSGSPSTSGAPRSGFGEIPSSTSADLFLTPPLAPLSNAVPDLDPVAASMERNRLLLQRMRQQQEMAQRELWSTEDLSPEEQASLEERRAHRRQQEEEEEIQLQRAIAESEVLARQQAGNRALSASTVSGRGNESDDELLKASLKHQDRQKNDSPSPLPSYSFDENEEVVATVEDPVQSDPSVEEIRRARLARFVAR